MLSACGGDEEQTAAATAAAPDAPPPVTQTPPLPSPSTNRAPTISGSPPGSVRQGTLYSFMPLATDADGDSLSFSVTGLPPWATFSQSTGRLRGTPTGAHVGSYSNIVISASDGTLSAALAAFGIEVVGTATGSATLSWTPPTQNTDGSPLTDLVGYRVYWGTSQNDYSDSVMIQNPGLATYVIDQLTPATWYFAVAAFNGSGVESPLSNVASKVIAP